MGTYLAHTVDGAGEAVIGNGGIPGLDGPHGLTVRKEHEKPGCCCPSQTYGCLAPSCSLATSLRAFGGDSQGDTCLWVTLNPQAGQLVLSLSHTQEQGAFGGGPAAGSLSPVFETPSKGDRYQGRTTVQVRLPEELHNGYCSFLPSSRPGEEPPSGLGGTPPGKRQKRAGRLHMAMWSCYPPAPALPCCAALHSSLHWERLQAEDDRDT